MLVVSPNHLSIRIHIQRFHSHVAEDVVTSPVVFQPQFSAELPPHSVLTAAAAPVEAAAQSPVSVADQSLVAAP